MPLKEDYKLHRVSMQITAKFNILATHQFNDITAFWLEEDGKVGFTIIPSGMEGCSLHT